ncbi:MAG: HAD family hydrolase [Brevinema sp.]
MKKQYKSIIFDLDGTLIDSEKRNAYALLEILTKKGHELVIEDVLPKMGRTGAIILRDFGIVEEEIDDYLNDWIEAVYHETQKPIELFEGILETLEILSNTKISLGIVSSKTRALYNIEKTYLNIDFYFSHVVLADDTEFHKPHPAPLLKYLYQSQFTAEDCIYIGDTYSDLICAKESNIDFGLACWGATSLFEKEQHIHRFDTPNKILNLLSL